MKKLILYFSVFLLLLSCSDNFEYEMNQSENLYVNAHQFYNSYLEEFKFGGKEVYRNYTANEKYLVWLGHLNSFRPILSETQMELIDQLLDNLNPEIFENDNEVALENFEEFYMKDWYSEVRLNFSFEEVSWVFLSPNPVNFQGVELQTVYIGICDCLKDAAWDTCTDNTLTTCMVTGCRPVRECGFLTLYNCNGLCKTISPE